MALLSHLYSPCTYIGVLKYYWNSSTQSLLKLLGEVAGKNNHIKAAMLVRTIPVICEVHTTQALQFD